MAKTLKVTCFPPPGSYTGQGMSVTYDQQEFKVNDLFEIDILEGSEWFQFEDVAGAQVAIPVRNIAAIALREE